MYGREPGYPAVAVFKAMILVVLKKMKFLTELERALIEDSELAEALGFIKDGVVLVPGYKNLWHFYNMKLGDGWGEVFALLRKEAVRKAESLKLRMGEDTVQDATPIEALRHDNEAEYNAHYEVKDVITDLKTGVPLSKRVTWVWCHSLKSSLRQEWT